jgi:hypothetical protein
VLLWRRAIDYTLSGYGDLNYEVQNIKLKYGILVCYSTIIYQGLQTNFYPKK